MPAVVDEEPPHRLRAERQSVGPILPVDGAVVLQPHPGFVHKSRRLKRVVPALPSQIAVGHPAQLAVDEREQFGILIGFLAHLYCSRDCSRRASFRGARSESASFHISKNFAYDVRAPTSLPVKSAARAIPRWASEYNMEAGTSPRRA